MNDAKQSWTPISPFKLGVDVAVAAMVRSLLGPVLWVIVFERVEFLPGIIDDCHNGQEPAR
jgi:hypothetical protein